MVLGLSLFRSCARLTSAAGEQDRDVLPVDHGGLHPRPLRLRGDRHAVHVILLGLADHGLRRVRRLGLRDLPQRHRLGVAGPIECRLGRVHVVFRVAHVLLGLQLALRHVHPRRGGGRGGQLSLRLGRHRPRREELLDGARDGLDHHGDLAHRLALGVGGVGLGVQRPFLDARAPQEGVAHEGHVAEGGADRPRGALGPEALALSEPRGLPLRQEHGALLGEPEGAERAPGDEALAHRGAETGPDGGVGLNVAGDTPTQVRLDPVGRVLVRDLLGRLRPLRGQRRTDRLLDHLLRPHVRGVVGRGNGRGRHGLDFRTAIILFLYGPGRNPPSVQA